MPRLPYLPLPSHERLGLLLMCWGDVQTARLLRVGVLPMARAFAGYPVPAAVLTAIAARVAGAVVRSDISPYLRTLGPAMPGRGE